MNEYSTPTTCLVNQTAEKKALDLLRHAGYQYLQQIDFLGFQDGRWTIFEVKERELFKPGQNFPYFGTGLDKSQIWLRAQLFKSLGLRTCLIVFDKDSDDVYTGYLDELESKGDYLDTKNHIRIYPIDHFTKLQTTKEGIEETTLYDFKVNTLPVSSS